MKRRKRELGRRIASISLVIALVITSLQMTVNPQTVKRAEAATEESIDLKAPLSECITDPNVLAYYTVLANAAKLGEISKVSGKPASQVLSECTDSKYKEGVTLGELSDFTGDINFSGLQIQYVDGIGWARGAAGFDLSKANFTSALNEVPAGEFAHCDMTKMILPSTVKKIGSRSFESCIKLTTLQIGDSVNEGVVDLTKVDEVGISAFQACSSITNVEFSPYGTRTAELKLGANAFSACNSLTEIKIPIKNAANLGTNAFAGCTSLTEVWMQNELSMLNNAVFQGVGSISSCVDFKIIDGTNEEGKSRLPAGISSIGDSCFSGAYISSMDLSGCTKLKEIQRYGFGGTIFSDGKIVLPASLEKMGARAFSAAGVTAIEIPENCTDIGMGAFSRSALMSVKLPKGLTEIKEDTFSDCDYLKSSKIVLPADSSLKTIGAGAFQSCEQIGSTEFLKDLKKLTEIGEKAFADCYTVQKNGLDQELSDLYGDKLLIKGGLEKIILPDSVEILGNSVFANNYALKTADLGAGIVSIPDRAFYNEKDTSSKSGAGLEKVIVSGELDSIGEQAFANQSRLHTIGYHNGSTVTEEEGKVQFKDGLLSIGDKAFSGCGIQSEFNLQMGVAYVPKGSVQSSGGSGLTKFLIYDYNKCEKEDNYCYTGYIDESQIVNKADLGDSNWDSKNNRLTEAGSAKYDEVFLLAKEVYLTDKCNEDSGEKSFEVYEEFYPTNEAAYKNRLYYYRENSLKRYYCSNADAGTALSAQSDGGTAVWAKIIQNSDIVNLAVSGVSDTPSLKMRYVFGIENVQLPDSVIKDNLGASAFEKCINLNEVKLPKNLTVIKDNTFNGAGKEIENPIGTRQKPEDKYNDYYGLHTVQLPEALLEIGQNAFRSCHNLVLDTKSGSSFGLNIESIGDNAFYECYSLDAISLPSELKKIGREAFAKCALQKPDDSKITREKNTYTYRENQETYGTKVTKKGLNRVDFTAAIALESVGDGAFSQTNVKNINMTKSPLVHIPDNLFKSCTYLDTISFQDGTESIGNNVLCDNVVLNSVTIPASAKVNKKTISGAFGEAVPGHRDPTMVLSTKETSVVVPIQGSLRLPINAINPDNLNGVISVEIAMGNDKYQNIIGEDNAVNGLYADWNKTDNPYSIILYGTQYIKEPVTVRVTASMKFEYANFSEYYFSPQTLDFSVMVKDLPTEKIELSADTTPDRYVVSGGKKTLYLPVGRNEATNGVKLTANLFPLETTDGVEWLSDNPAITTVSDAEYTKGSGVATAKVKTTGIGTAKVTVKSGEATDTITVQSVIPVKQNGMSCSTSGTFLGTELKPNSENDPYSLSINDGDKFNISLDYGDEYTKEQQDTFGEKVVFTSSDDKIISVSPDGTFKAMGEGKAKITVSTQGSGAKLEFWFEVADGNNYTPQTVNVYCGEQLLTKDNKALVDVGSSISLSAKVAPSKASQDVTWEVTNGKDIVSVDENGKVTGLKKGTAKVVAKSKEKDSVKSVEVTIEVMAPVKALKILDGDVSLEVGKELRISKVSEENKPNGYFVSPVDTTDKISWASSNEGVVSVTNQDAQSVTVKAVAAGTATLTAKAASGIQASINITVPTPLVKVNGITVDKEVTLNVGGTHQLRPQITPADANESVTYEYSTSNKEVATVDANGLIRAVGPGTVGIQAKTSTGKSATCNVTVKAPAKKVAIVVNKPSFKKIYMAKGQSVNLKAKITPENTTDTIKWKSNKAKIASVDGNGVVSAKKKGTAKITATATSKKKATITVVVQKKEVKAKKVKLKAAKTLKRGKTIRVTPTLKSAKSTDTVSFSSNKPAVAKVDEYGYVTGLKKGKVKITVTASSGKKATKTIKVK